MGKHPSWFPFAIKYTSISDSWVGDTIITLRVCERWTRCNQWYVIQMITCNWWMSVNSLISITFQNPFVLSIINLKHILHSKCWNIWKFSCQSSHAFYIMFNVFFDFVILSFSRTPLCLVVLRCIGAPFVRIVVQKSMKRCKLAIKSENVTIFNSAWQTTTINANTFDINVPAYAHYTLAMCLLLRSN